MFSLISQCFYISLKSWKQYIHTVGIVLSTKTNNVFLHLVRFSDAARFSQETRLNCARKSCLAAADFMTNSFSWQESRKQHLLMILIPYAHKRSHVKNHSRTALLHINLYDRCTDNCICYVKVFFYVFRGYVNHLAISVPALPCFYVITLSFCYSWEKY